MIKKMLCKIFSTRKYDEEIKTIKEEFREEVLDVNITLRKANADLRKVTIAGKVFKAIGNN